MLLQTINELGKGNIEGIVQSSSSIFKDGTLHHAQKIFTETCEINWNNNTNSIHDLILGLSPYPAAFTFLQGKKLKIFCAEKGNR